MSKDIQYRILFVCMGNICRSPTAEGVFRKLARESGLADRILVDSAGTHAYHVGEPPDRRARETALERGIDLSELRARCVEAADFERFDHILAMDLENHRHLARLCPPGREYRLRLFLEFAPQLRLKEVPDPYYGGQRGFEQVFDMLEEASRGLLAELRADGLERGRSG